MHIISDYMMRIWGDKTSTNLRQPQTTKSIKFTLRRVSIDLFTTKMKYIYKENDKMYRNELEMKMDEKVSHKNEPSVNRYSYSMRTF